MVEYGINLGQMPLQQKRQKISEHFNTQIPEDLMSVITHGMVEKISKQKSRSLQGMQQVTYAALILIRNIKHELRIVNSFGKTTPEFIYFDLKVLNITHEVWFDQIANLSLVSI